MVGDFNYSTIDWKCPDSPRLNSEANSQAGRFLKTIEDCFFSQLVNVPTFFKCTGENEGRDKDKDETTKNTKEYTGNVLDLIITDSAEEISYMSNHPPLGSKQGHCVLKWKLRVRAFTTGLLKIYSDNKTENI